MRRVQVGMAYLEISEVVVVLLAMDYSVSIYTD